MFYQLLSCSPVEELWPASFKVLCHLGRDSERSPAVAKRRRCFPWIAPAKQWPRECWQHLGMKKGLINHGEVMNIDQLWVGLKIVGPNPNLIINHGKIHGYSHEMPMFGARAQFSDTPICCGYDEAPPEKSWLEATKMRGVFRQRPGDAQYNHGGWPIKWWFQWQEWAWRPKSGVYTNLNLQIRGVHEAASEPT